MELDHRSPRNLATARLPLGGLPGDPTYCEWGAVVGGRIRRLRRSRGATLRDLGLAVVRGDGTHYSAGFVSRLERGKSSAPLYAYLAIADALKVDAGVLLGPDAATIEITDAEATLVRCVRELGLEPHEVIVRLLRDREADPQLAPVDDYGFSAAVE
jgi:transcriptional regulator with XRE-family HTH domain